MRLDSTSCAHRARHFRRRVSLRLLLIGLPLALAGCSGVMNPQGPIGGANRMILLDALGIMLAIVVPTIIAALVFAWWFRASNTKARYRPTFAYSGELELIVWSIPILVIMFLGGVIWIGSHELDPAEPIASAAPPLDVQVVSLDWKWLFIYPQQGIASVNHLVVPAGVPVHFALTSATVMNTFFVPQLGSMIATMNGMQTQLNLMADKPGEFHGESAQFSGDGFSDMDFTMQALPQDQFMRWATSVQQSSGPTLDLPGYAALSKESENVHPFTYHAIDQSLFRRILTRQTTPNAGPSTGRGGPAVHPMQEN